MYCTFSRWRTSFSSGCAGTSCRNSIIVCEKESKIKPMLTWLAKNTFTITFGLDGGQFVPIQNLRWFNILIGDYTLVLTRRGMQHRTLFAMEADGAVACSTARAEGRMYWQRTLLTFKPFISTVIEPSIYYYIRWKREFQLFVGGNLVSSPYMRRQAS